MDSTAASTAARDAERIAAELIGQDGGTDPFVAAVRATRMPMIITNPRMPDNPVVFCNDSFSRLSGYPREEILGRNCRFLQGPETDPATVRRIHDAVARVEPIEIDIRNHRKDGEPFWNRLLLAPVFDATGTLAYFFASQVDVTLERERLKGLESDNAALLEELTGRLRMQEEHERELAFTLKAARFGTWSVDLDTHRLSASDICKQIFGRPADEPFTYDQRLAAIHPGDRDRNQSELARSVGAGDDFDITYRIVRPDGETRWIASRGQPFFNAEGRPLRIAGVSIDVTDQRRADRMQAALAELADVFRDAADPADVAYGAARIISGVLGADRVAYGSVDSVAETIDVERDCNADGIPSIQGRHAFRDYGSYIADLKRGDTVVVTDVRTDPRTAAMATAFEAIAVRALINLPVMEHGDLVALLCINHNSARAWRDDELAFVRDVGERTRVAAARRRAEGELAALNASLEQQVVDRTRELQSAEEALRQSQKMEAVGQLTGGVAHDFNNLLTVIRSATDLLKRPDLSEERRTRYVDAIADTADRAAKLTGQLLAFARRQALKPEAIDVGRNLAGLDDMLRTLTGARVQVDMVLPAEPCVIHADPNQFDTAIVNMAANARDAMDGEGRVTIAVAPATSIPAMRAHPAIAGDFVAVSITDTGEGIAADAIDRIFEPFFTTKSVGQGTGLGLSQVFGFAKQSGGDILVESREGEGATFTMYLPRAMAAPHDEHDAEPAAPADGHGATVLVVEDNADVGAFTTQSLTDLGYRPVWAADADAALAALAQDHARFDIVFSDVVMPGMNGIDLGRIIRTRYPQLPVVLTSGYSDVLAERGAGEFNLLHKPYSVDQLSRALRRATGPADGGA